MKYSVVFAGTVKLVVSLPLRLFFTFPSKGKQNRKGKREKARLAGPPRKEAAALRWFPRRITRRRGADELPRGPPYLPAKLPCQAQEQNPAV